MNRFPLSKSLWGYFCRVLILESMSAGKRLWIVMSHLLRSELQDLQEPLVFCVSAPLYSPLAAACTGSCSIIRKFFVSKLFSLSGHLDRRTVWLSPPAPSSMLNIQSSWVGTSPSFAEVLAVFKCLLSRKSHIVGCISRLEDTWYCFGFAGFMYSRKVRPFPQRENTHDFSEWK